MQQLSARPPYCIHTMGRYQSWSEAVGKATASVAVLYSSDYGYSDRLSQTLARGITKAGAATEMVDVLSVDPQVRCPFVLPCGKACRLGLSWAALDLVPEQQETLCLAIFTNVLTASMPCMNKLFSRFSHCFHAPRKAIMTKVGVNSCCKSMCDIFVDGYVCLHNGLHGHAAELGCNLDELLCMT